MAEDAPKEIDTTLPGWVHIHPVTPHCSYSCIWPLRRVHGVVQAPKRPRPNHISSRRSRASTRARARTTRRRMSSSPRSATRRRPSTSSRTCRTRTRARRSSSAAWRSLSVQNGIPASASSAPRCRRSLRRYVWLVLTGRRVWS